MKVKTLIKKLKKLPPEFPVLLEVPEDSVYLSDVVDDGIESVVRLR